VFLRRGRLGLPVRFGRFGCFAAQTQRGMSLIETLCSLTIMGTLAATALPQLVQLGTQARVSVVQGLSGAVQSASILVHAQCAVQPSCPHRSGQGVVEVSTQPVRLHRGYPVGGHQEGIAAAMQLSGFTVQHLGDDTVFMRSDAPEASACAVRYSAPEVDGGIPSIVTRTDGC